MPEVSVIIPTYNSARYLVEAVQSVLAQSFQDFEVLVIDDGSTDETKEVMSRYGHPVRYLRQANSGVSVARNHGIEESRGRYVAFLDADDLWLRNKLAMQKTVLANSSQHAACYSALQIVTDELKPIELRPSRRQGRTLEDLLLHGNVIATPSSVICERSLFAMVGGFDPELSLCADWDMWVRLAAVTEFIYIDDPQVIYRQHEGNMSRNASVLESDSLRLLEKGFGMACLSEPLRTQRRRAFARNYMVLAGRYFQVGRYRDFARCAARSVAMDFHQVSYLMAYPARVAARWRSHQPAETA